MYKKQYVTVVLIVRGISKFVDYPRFTSPRTYNKIIICLYTSYWNKPDPHKMTSQRTSKILIIQEYWPPRKIESTLFFFYFSTKWKLESLLNNEKTPPPPPKKIKIFYCYDRRLCLGKMHGSRFNNQ